MPPRLARWLAVPAFLFCASAQAQGDTTITPPFVTTPPEVVDRMLALAGTKPTDYVVDLGSGDGRIVIAAAKKYGARSLGLELDPKLVALSRENARAAGVADRAEFQVQDVLRADYAKATVVTAYLLPWLLAQLSPVFLDGLRPGARIVTHAFVFPSWKPDRTEKVRLAVPHPSQGDESTIFLWTVPANSRGLWQAASPQGKWRVRIDQNFQELDVEGDHDGVPLKITSAKLNGVRVDLTGTVRNAPFSFRGTVDGNRIAGEMETGTDKRITPLVFTK
jgi:hypothetical protein